MFGIGPQELVVVGLLALLIFGPGKLPQMARDLGGFARKAQRSVDEFKSEFTLSEDPHAEGSARREEKDKGSSSSAPRGQEGRAQQASSEGGKHEPGADEESRREAPMSAER